MVLADEEAKEAAQGVEAAVLALDGEWLVVALAVVVEVALVALEDGEGDLGGRGEAALLGPLRKPAEVVSRLLDGRGR